MDAVRAEPHKNPETAYNLLKHQPSREIKLEAFDIFEVCRRKDGISGAVPVAELEGLDTTLADGRGEVEYELAGLGEIRGIPAFSLVWKADVAAVCGRCEKAVEVHLEGDKTFLCTKSEEEADAMPIDEDEEGEDVIVGSKKFDLAALLAEEILLEMPDHPKHDDCRPDFEWKDEEPKQETTRFGEIFKSALGKKQA